jgi:hypothetical protein
VNPPRAIVVIEMMIAVLRIRPDSENIHFHTEVRSSRAPPREIGVNWGVRPVHIARGSEAPCFPPRLLQARLADLPFARQVTLDVRRFLKN